MKPELETQDEALAITGTFEHLLKHHLQCLNMIRYTENLFLASIIMSAVTKTPTMSIVWLIVATLCLFYAQHQRMNWNILSDNIKHEQLIKSLKLPQ